jgi:excisionase family DNA binding protein
MSCRQHLNVADAATSLGCSKQKIRDLFDAGELEGFRVGRNKRIFADSVEDFIAKHSNKKGSPLPPVVEPPTKAENPTAPTRRPRLTCQFPLLGV